MSTAWYSGVMIDPPRRRILLAALPVALAAGVVAFVIALADDDSGGADREAPEVPADEPVPPFEKHGESGGSDGVAQPAPSDEHEVARTVRRYIDAIDARDGAAVCESLAPGAIENFELPRGGAGCAKSMRASIGYRDPRGFPVFESVRLHSIGDIAIGAGQARATATVVTQFADRDEPSIEDDVVYLVPVGSGWRVARPSSTLYRAVGRPEVPPKALAPPP
jgi:ketosteroid isomerase-like protein